MHKDTSTPPGTIIIKRRILRDLLLLCTGGLLVVTVLIFSAWNPRGVNATTGQDARLADSNLSRSQGPTDYSSSQKLRKYYLTKTTWSGSNATNANVCLDGFHMASAWELLNTSNLQYYRHNNSLIQADSGHGPPSYINGWVHTGYAGDISDTLGRGNCNNWSEEGSGQAGTSLWLPSSWFGAFELHFWEGTINYCSTDNYVWCIQDAIDVTPPMRQFYLTREASYNGAEPDGGDGYGAGICSLGYHFASMWEIMDPSSLQYNVNLGETRGDSAMGPPSGLQGWIRNGGISSDSISTGQGNCFSWDSSGTGEYGTTVALPTDWLDANQQDMHIWTTDSQVCSTDQRVWCVADEVNGYGSCAVPETISCGQLLRDSTFSMPSHLSTYECASGWNESGPEKVYALTLAEGWTYDVTASLDIIDPVDLDIFFLTKDGCSTGAAMNSGACGDTAVTQYELPPGTYYIVVDGYNGAWGDYYLEVECTPKFVYLPAVKK